MQLKDLILGQPVKIRHGRAGQTAPNWSEWRNSTVEYLVRRTEQVPKHLQKRTYAPNVGDIISIAVQDWPCEYSQGDYCGEGVFLAEDWYLQIEGLS